MKLCAFVLSLLGRSQGPRTLDSISRDTSWWGANPALTGILVQAVARVVLGIEGKVPPKAACTTSRFGSEFPVDLVELWEIQLVGLSKADWPYLATLPN